MVGKGSTCFCYDSPGSRRLISASESVVAAAASQLRRTDEEQRSTTREPHRPEYRSRGVVSPPLPGHLLTSVLTCNQAVHLPTTTLSEAEISLREPGNRNKNTCSLSQQFPHRSAITSRCRKTRTDRQILPWRLRVCTPDSPGERRPWLARAKTSERGGECRADTRCRHAQRASRTALDTGREDGCPAPSSYLLSPGRAVQLGRLL